MKKYLIVIVIAFVCIKGFSQTEIDSKQGFIIKNSGDTLKGYVKSFPLHKLSKEIFFKEESEVDYTRLSPSDIKGYSIDSVQFTSYKSVDIIRRNKKKEVVVDTVVSWRFLRLVVEGELNLYVINESSESSKFLVKTEDNAYTELSREITFAGSKKITNNKYKPALGKVMANSHEMTELIMRTEFNEKSISKTIDSYNRINGRSILTKFPHLLQVDYSFYIQLDKYRNTYKIPTWGYSVGFESHLYKPTKSNDFEFTYGLFYSMFSFSGKKGLNVPKIGILSEDYAFKTNSFNFPIYLSYNNREKRFSPICEIGLNPTLFKEEETISGEFNEGKWWYNTNLLINLGLRLNTNKNYSIKYIVKMYPFLLNSLQFSYWF